MSALTTDIDAPQRVGELFDHPVAAAKTLFAGGIGVLDGSGNLTPGALASGLVAVGRIEEHADNSNGAAGDINASVRRGVFRFANSATNPVARTHIGGDCYIEDDQTVGSLATGMSVCGKVLNVDTDGVWVEIN